jgi:hypothetical protein
VAGWQVQGSQAFWPAPITGQQGTDKAKKQSQFFLHRHMMKVKASAASRWSKMP